MPEEKKGAAAPTAAEAEHTMTPEEMQAMRKHLVEMQAMLDAMGKAQTAMQAENEQLKASAAKLHLEADQAKRARVESEIGGAIEKLKREGRYLPVFDELGIPRVLSHLAIQAEKDAPQVFSEGKPATSVYASMRAFLDKMPKLIELGETVPVGSSGKKCEIDGSERSQALVLLTEERLEQATKQGRKLDFSAAMREVSKEHRELVQLG